MAASPGAEPERPPATGVSPRFDLKLRPSPLEWFVDALRVPLLGFEILGMILAVEYPAAFLVRALSAPDHPRWLPALGWFVLLAGTVVLLVILVCNQAQSKMSHPGYLFRRLFRSRLVVDGQGVELGQGCDQRWPWSDIARFEVREDLRVAPRAGTWTEVCAVMRLKSGEVVELPALGCFHERWRRHIQRLKQRVDRLNELRLSAG